MTRFIQTLTLFHEFYKAWRGMSGGDYTLLSNYAGEYLVSFHLVLGDIEEDARSADPA